MMHVQLANNSTANVSTSTADLLQSLDADEQWRNLPNDIDTSTDHWPAKVINCLSLINSRYITSSLLTCIVTFHRPDSSSIVISKEHLISMISKTVIFGLAPYIPITSHYSTAKLGE